MATTYLGYRFVLLGWRLAAHESHYVDAGEKLELLEVLTPASS